MKRMKSRKNRKTIFPLILLILVVSVALIGGVILVRTSQETRRGAYYGAVSAGIWPDAKQVDFNSGNFDLYLKVIPGDHLITGTEMNLSFDNSILELVDMEFDDLFSGPKRITQANTTGTIPILAVTTADRNDLHNEPFNLVKLTFKPKSAGSTQITRVGDYKIVGSRGQTGVVDRTLELKGFSLATVTVGGGDTIPTTGVPYPTEVLPPEEAWPEGGWPTLEFKIKFAGTTYRVGNQQVTVSNIPDQKVKVIVKKFGSKWEFSDVMVSFDEKAIGTGEVELVGVPVGTGYTVFIKGPAHLARKFCSNKQKDRCRVDEGEIVLKQKISYDWTGLELEPGDINQDGVVDASDFSQLKQAIGLQGEGIKEDLNFNGVVNTQDIALFLETLSTKYEEEG